MNRDQAVVARIHSVLNEYMRGLNPQPVPGCRLNFSYEYMLNVGRLVYTMNGVNFQYESSRITYMYLYFMQYCYVVYRVLCDLHEHILARFTETKVLKVCCIGSGPGTELVALIIFLQEKNMLPPTLHCTIIGKDIEWEETWNKIWENFPGKPHNYLPKVFYESCDLMENGYLPEGVLRAVSAAHIVTMVTAYSRSYEIIPNPTNMPRLRCVFDAMSSESRMLFIENDFNYENHFWKYHAAPAGVTRVLQPSNYNGGIINFDTDYSDYPQILQYNCEPRFPISDCRAIADIFKPDEFDFYY